MFIDLHAIKSTKINCNRDIICDRDQFIIDMSRGKRILHIGCVGNRDFEDPLHLRISNVAELCHGWDINVEGIHELKKLHPGLTIHNIDVCGSEIRLNEQYDLIIFGEVLEHLPNPGFAIENSLRILSDNGCILVTVPNAFGIRNFIENSVMGSELTRTDHCAYYSFVTLNRLFAMYSMSFKNYHYYSNVNLKNSMRNFLKKYFLGSILRMRPSLAEGIVGVFERNK